MSHLHDVIDPDSHFIIDGDTREVYSSDGEIVTVVQHDHKSEIITFELPHYVENHDMTLCDTVEIHWASSASKKNPDQPPNFGIYENITLELTREDKVTFSWMLDGDVTNYPGTVVFAIVFMCTTNGAIDYSWGTLACKDIKVESSVYNSNSFVEKNENLLVQWKQNTVEALQEYINEKLKVSEDGFRIATKEVLGSVRVGDNLEITEDGILSCPVATESEKDNTKPITSAAVYTELGNIHVLLQTI